MCDLNLDLHADLECFNHLWRPAKKKTVKKVEMDRMNEKTDQIVLLIAVPATGTMTLARMSYFFPSKARVFVRPMIPALAVEYCNSLLLLSLSLI